MIWGNDPKRPSVLSRQQLHKMYGNSCKILETKAYWTEGKDIIVGITVPTPGTRNKKVPTRARIRVDVVCKDEGKERKTKTRIGVRDLEVQLPSRGTQKEKTQQVMDFTYKD